MGGTYADCDVISQPASDTALDGNSPQRLKRAWGAIQDFRLACRYPLSYL